MTLVYSPVAMLLVYDVLFYGVPIYRKNYTSIPAVLLVAIVSLQLVGIGSLVAFAHSCKRVISRASFGSNDETPSVYRLTPGHYILVILFTVAIIGYLLERTLNHVSISELLQNWALFYALSRRGTAWLHLLRGMLMYVLLIDLYMNGITTKRLLLFFVVQGLDFLMGGRSTFIITSLFLFFSHIFIHMGTISRKIIILGIITTFFLFLLSSSFRQGGIEQYFRGGAILLDFDQAFVLNDVMEAVTESGPSWMVSVVDFVFMFVPRSLYAEKPISTAETRLIYPHVAQYGTNYTFGIYGNIILNAGFFGFIIIFTFIILTNIIYVNHLVKRRRNLLGFLKTFFWANYIQFIRGGLINSRWFMQLTLVLLAFAVYSALTHWRRNLVGLFRSVQA